MNNDDFIMITLGDIFREERNLLLEAVFDNASNDYMRGINAIVSRVEAFCPRRQERGCER